MRNVVSSLLFVLLSVFCVNISFSQVVQKQANKHQLINGVKLESKHSKQNLVKLNATSVKKVNNLQNTQVPKKHKKPKKILKYRKKRMSRDIKKEDD